jgi:lipoprotein
MIKYVIFLLTFVLIGCSNEPSFPDPIKPTENKTETIQKWIDYFKPYNIVYDRFDSVPKPKDKNICFLNPKDFPENTVANIDIINNNDAEKQYKNKLFLKTFNSLYISDDLETQCNQSYLRLKNKYESLLVDKPIISEQDYQEFNNIYLEERLNVINKINSIVKQCKETELKNKELNDYQNKNGLPITENSYSC